MDSITSRNNRKDQIGADLVSKWITEGCWTEMRAAGDVPEAGDCARLKGGQQGLRRRLVASSD